MLVRFNKNVSLDDVGKLTMRCEALDVQYRYIRELSASYLVVESSEQSKLDELYHQFRHLHFVEIISYPQIAEDPLQNLDNVKIKFGNRWIGKGSRPVIIAGSPYLESQKHAVQLACDLAAVGVNIYKAGPYRPGDTLNPKDLYERTSTIISEITRKSGLPSTGMIELLSSRAALSSFQPCAYHVPGNLLYETTLRETLGKLNIPVLLERHPNLSTNLWLDCARTVLKGGNSDIALIETGIASATDDIKLTPSSNPREIMMLTLARMIESCPLPVLVYPSQVAQSAEQVERISRAAIAIGAAGIILDVHPNPIEGLLSDGFCLSLSEFEEMFKSFRSLL